MSDEHALYAAIIADPNDEAARRALAAHYDAKGDPRGELIRVQLELAPQRDRGDPSGKLLLREEALIKAHGRAIAAPLADLISGFKLHRGLIGQVELPLDRFLDVAPTLFASAPIQHLSLTGPRTKWLAFLRSPHLARLSTLALDELGLGDDDARQIAAAETFRHLRWLSLADNEIGVPGVEALAASPWLANLPVIDLTNNPCDPVPRPGAYELDGRVTAIDRPPLADELVRKYGPRPWLDDPTDPNTWPLPRDTYR